MPDDRDPAPGQAAPRATAARVHLEAGRKPDPTLSRHRAKRGKQTIGRAATKVTATASCRIRSRWRTPERKPAEWQRSYKLRAKTPFSSAAARNNPPSRCAQGGAGCPLGGGEGRPRQSEADFPEFVSGSCIRTEPGSPRVDMAGWHQLPARRISAVRAGTTSNKSPTIPNDASLKIGASGSRLIATI